MADVFVARSDEIQEGGRTFISCEVGDIGVLRVKGKLHAYLNICPHQGGPVCSGMLIHRVEEIIAEDKTFHGMRFHENDVNIVCPWHGWEFNVETGRCAGDGQWSLRRFKVSEDNGEIYVSV